MEASSSDAVGALEFANIGDYRRNVAAGQTFDRRHVPETPVMGRYAVRDGALKRLVAMVAGLVDDMDQRRGDSALSGSVPSMADRAFCFVRFPPDLRPCREGIGHDYRCDRRPVVHGIAPIAEEEKTCGDQGRR